MPQLSQLCLLSLLLVSLSGCSTTAYYSQAIGGHLSLMMARQPVDGLLDDPALEPDLRQRLQTAIAARDFAGQSLQLPADDSFTDYVSFQRPWVVVNLVAAPEFSLQPHQWCYPIIGCQAYRGYFDPGDASRERERFRQQGYDTFVGGVTAYSTLGWFNDPLHTGFIRLPEDRMVALIFHELSHQVVYLDGDTAFNESYATAVELEGLKRWLKERGKAGRFRAALARLERAEQTRALVQTTVVRLERLYADRETQPEAVLRDRKHRLLVKLRDDYRQLADTWQEPGPLGRDPGILNNASLALFRQYHQHVPAFRQLLREQDGDFGRFHQAVRRLARQPVRQRQDELERLASSASDLTNTLELR